MRVPYYGSRSEPEEEHGRPIELTGPVGPLSREQIEHALLLLDGKSFREAVGAVAQDLGISPEWLNDDFKEMGILPERGDLVFRGPSLVAYAASTHHLLAMKLAAWRDDIDIEDALQLYRQTASGDPEDVWSTIGGLIPPDRRGRARHNFETLVELADEPS